MTETAGWKATWRRLIPVAVIALICFLAYSSQYLFTGIDPAPLHRDQFLIFNALVIAIFPCYFRACTTPPGRLHATQLDDTGGADVAPSKGRWCRKCQAIKLPRWHHCRSCERCIPKMDHHCVWIRNCVSHTTFPHFIRFLIYCVAAMTYLEYLLFFRFKAVWDKRALPSYHGPTHFQLAHLVILALTNSLTLFALSILLFTSLRGLVLNETTIEGWEKDRHVALLRRSRAMGGYVYGPGGIKIWITRQEFPYDIGFWSNLKQGMGTSNIFAWLWPFASSPTIDGSLAYEVNGFEDEGLVWPPPDPDRIPVYRDDINPPPSEYQPNPDCASFSSIDVDAFRKRQAEDLKRHAPVQRRRPFYDSGGAAFQVMNDNSLVGEEGWRNTQGERLEDFGVDQDVEFYDDDVPLAELMRRRKGV